MATGESDLSPSTASSLNLPAFATVPQGYDPGQVVEYVTMLKDRVQALETEVRQLQSGLVQKDASSMEHEPAQDVFEGLGARVAELVRAFDHDVERLRGEAEAEASRVVAEANADAERVRVEAETLLEGSEAEIERIQAEARAQAVAEADRIRLDAQGEAEEVRLQAAEALRAAQRASDGLLSGLATRREAMLGEFRTMHERMLSSARDMQAIIDAASAQDEVVVVEDAEARNST